MTLQITIIGLGQIGASVGLALEKHKKNILRIGHDKDMGTAKTAQKMGAVDKVKRNLPDSVRDADVILLALPFSEINETLGYIKEDLKESVVVLDTAPNKAVTNEWMKEQKCAYIGLAPAINPLYLEEKQRGVDSAHADLFEKAVTMIAAPVSASGEVLQLATDFVTLIGSHPLFADVEEVDGVITTAQILPQIISAALLNASIDAPGWGEAKKVAGLAYFQSTEASQNHAGDASLSAELLLENPNVSRIVGGMIESLQKIQENITNGDATALSEMLSNVAKERDNWLNERHAAEWLLRGEKTDGVRLGGIAERFFGFKERK